MPTAVTSGSKTTSWSKMFPEVSNSEKSATFVKKLFAVALSNVLYLRGIFPEAGFIERNLEGIRLKIIRDDSPCPGCEKVCSWVRGCFDALDKKYLKKAMIGFYKTSESGSQEECLVEAYYFKFDYFSIDDGADGISVNVRREVPAASSGMDAMSQDMFTSCDLSSSQEQQQRRRQQTAPPGVTSHEAVRDATIRLLRTIIMASQTVAPLTDNVVMKMRLFYNECTPDEYEPPGFRADPDSPARLPEEEIELRLGDVFTKFNGFHMMLSTGRDYFRDSATNSKRQHDSKKVRKPTPAAGAPAAAPLSQASDAASDVNNNSIGGSAEINEDAADDEELSVRCPCERDAEMGIMIRCEACELWQHAVCFGILRESEAPPEHYCEVCVESKFLGETDNLPADSHDQLVQRMRAPVERRSFCLVRAALNALLELNDPVTPGRLSERLSVPVQSAGNLVKKLMELGALVAPPGGAGDCSIDRVQLRRHLLPKFFGRSSRSGGGGGVGVQQESASESGRAAETDRRKEQEESGATKQVEANCGAAGGRKRPGRPSSKRGGGAPPPGAVTPKSRRRGASSASSKRGRYGSVVNTPLKI